MKFINTIILLAISSSSLASGVAVGTIKGYVFTETGVYVSSDAAITSKPTSNVTNRFYLAYSSAHSQTFIAVVLSAFVAEQAVSLNGTGNCAGGNSEILRKICTFDVPC